jgi:hypothetical protein
VPGSDEVLVVGQREQVLAHLRRPGHRFSR